MKYNPDDMEPEITDTFFDPFNPATDSIDKVIYDRIFKKNASDYHKIEDFNPFAAMGGFLRKTITIKNIEGNS